MSFLPGRLIGGGAGDLGELIVECWHEGADRNSFIGACHKPLEPFIRAVSRTPQRKTRGGYESDSAAAIFKHETMTVRYYRHCSTQWGIQRVWRCRKLDWKAPISSGRVAPKTPNASHMYLSTHPVGRNRSQAYSLSPMCS